MLVIKLLLNFLLLLSFDMVINSCLAWVRHSSLPTRLASPTCRTPGSRQVNSFSKLDDLLGDVERLISETDGVSGSDANWRNVKWSSVKISQTDARPSPVERKMIRGRLVYIKRDDLLRLHGSQISGNKARKMLALNGISPRDFPSCVVSFGGPQSNSMLALAAIVNFKNREILVEGDDVKEVVKDVSDGLLNEDNVSSIRRRFVYYTKKLPRLLREQPSGNLFRAQALGMELAELSPQEYNDLFGSDWGGSPKPPPGLDPPVLGDSLWVPQGGAFEMAYAGADLLAQEILSFWIESGNGKPLSVCLPGGTCSTAVLVHHALKRRQNEKDDECDIRVVVIPCVGDASYARRQMMALSSQIGADTKDIPSILLPAPEDKDCQERKYRYFPFGEPNSAILDTFTVMKEEQELVLDLVYGAPAWTILLRHWCVSLSADLSFDPNNPIAGREIMVIHSGGLEGINSQLLRYKYKGLLTTKDVQLPGKGQHCP